MEFDMLGIKKDLYREHVLKRLEEAIIKNEFKPGDHLVETKISEIFGVSRGPVREAIAELEIEGLIDRVPYKGAVVSRLTTQDISELKSCRMTIEILAAKLVFENIEKFDLVLKELNAIVCEMKTSVKQDDLSLMLALDYKFHNELILQTNNKLLVEIWKPISVRLRRYFYLNSREKFVPLLEAVKQHQGIYDAFFLRDLEKVTELLNSHHCWS